jgi:hypothetical protein
MGRSDLKDCIPVFHSNNEREGVTSRIDIRRLSLWDPLEDHPLIPSSERRGNADRNDVLLFLNFPQLPLMRDFRTLKLDSFKSFPQNDGTGPAVFL